MDLSVIIPCYNEEESISELHKRVLSSCENADIKTFEIIFINDGSTDNTLKILQELHKLDPHIVIIDLSRNHGQQLALSAGLHHATGDYIFLLDADLQDPPELLQPMLDKARTGVDVVYGKRKERKGETWLKLATSKLFYKTLSFLSDTDIPENVGDFRLITKRVKDHVVSMPEQHRYVRGMISWVGFTQEEFLYERDARFAGETKWSFGKLLHFSVDAISSFSIRPLRISLLFAFIGCIIAAGLAMYAIYGYYFKNPISGWASLATIITFFSSLQLICIGVIGEYVGRAYMQGKNRPLFIIRDIYETNSKN